jgi:hypothetical protein
MGSCGEPEEAKQEYWRYKGEMEVSPVLLVSDGIEEAVVTVIIWKETENGYKLESDVETEILSTRNSWTETVDFMDPPVAVTDDKGAVVVAVTSFTPGEAVLGARRDGTSILSETDSQGDRQLRRSALFLADCDGPQYVRCSGVCTDVENDVENCGECGNACYEGRVCMYGRCWN